MRPIILLAASLFACVGTAAPAQTFGPPIQGLCLLSRAGAISTSRAGQSMKTQLGQLQATLKGELAQRRSVLDQQRRALAVRQNAVAPIEYQRQQAALDKQAQALDQEQNIRFIAAQTRGQQQVDQALNVALGRVVTRTACSVVLERDTSYGWNNAMDITGAVTSEMDVNAPTVALQ